MKIKPLFLSLILMLTLGACAQSGQSGTEASSPLPPKKAQTELQENTNMVLLDVRTPREYNNGHLKEARLLNFYEEDFKQQIDELPRDTTYMVYCHSGGRSAKAVRMMKQMGFKKVYDLKGGVAAWNKQGLPLQKEK